MRASGRAARREHEEEQISGVVDHARLAAVLKVLGALGAVDRAVEEAELLSLLRREHFLLVGALVRELDPAAFNAADAGRESLDAADGLSHAWLTKDELAERMDTDVAEMARVACGPFP